MGTIKKFEDIEAWQLARELVRDAYSLTGKKGFSKDFAFANQIQRSVVSVMANIAEGFERFSNREFTQYLNIAKGSSGELRSHFYIALDLGYVSDKEFDEIKNKCEKVSGAIWHFIKYLKSPK